MNLSRMYVDSPYSSSGWEFNKITFFFKILLFNQNLFYLFCRLEIICFFNSSSLAKRSIATETSVFRYTIVRIRIFSKRSLTTSAILIGSPEKIFVSYSESSAPHYSSNFWFNFNVSKLSIVFRRYFLKPTSICLSSGTLIVSFDCSIFTT